MTEDVKQKSLASRIKADRRKRRMSWPAYAEWMGVKMSTIYKIAQGRTDRPHELTVDLIEAKLAEPLPEAATT